MAPSSLQSLLLFTGATALGSFTLISHRYQTLLQQESQLPSTHIPIFKTDASKQQQHSSAADPKQQEQHQRLKQQKQQQQSVIVIGGGVVGVTTAYVLARRGHRVTVLEPRSAPAEECSACAAGGMQISNPAVDRNTWMAVLKCLLPWIGESDGEKDKFRFFHIRWWQTITDPLFIRWIVTFTRTSLLPNIEHQEKQKEMLKFTQYAVHDMIHMMEDPNENIAQVAGYNPRGSISLSYELSAKMDLKAENKYNDDAEHTGNNNPVTSDHLSLEPYRTLVGSQISELEPSVKMQAIQPTTAKYEFESRAASSERFTKELARRCTSNPALDVVFLYETHVRAIQTTTEDTADDKPRISEIRTSRGVIPVGPGIKVVVAAGAWTSHVLALMGLYAPVYPLKGYSLSLRAAQLLREDAGDGRVTTLREQDLPSRIVSDKYMFTTRLGDEIRITSIGEFSGWETRPTTKIDKEFRKEAVRQFPQLEKFIEKAPTRCGHRPYVSDGLLLLGQVDTRQDLLISCGPGSNGWKLAMGSAQVIERLVRGQNAQQISKELGFDVNALSPKGRVLEAPLFVKLCRVRWNV